MSEQVRKTETQEKGMGTLKFHNLELFLSLNEKKMDPQRVLEAINNLKASISHVEQEILAETENKKETLKLITENEIESEKVEAVVESHTAEVADEEIHFESDFLTLKPKAKNDKPLVKAKRFSSKNYFNTRNHLDLFNIGSFYFQEFQKSKKSFGFYAGSSLQDSHETLLGLASYFNYHEDLKVTLVVDNFKKSVLSRYLKESHTEIRSFAQQTYEVIIADGVEVFEYTTLRHFALKLGRENLELFLDELINDSEISLWDIPDLDIIEQEREFFFQLMRKIDSTSIILSRGKSKAATLKKFLDYTKKYNLRIDGVLFDKGRESKNDKRS